jgi:glyoxylase-like metal-dependent hydrolase (beta-lactamase superfamily II)
MRNAPREPLDDSASAGHSRRRFLTGIGLLGAGAWLGPRWLHAQEKESVIDVFRRNAGTASIGMERLRGGITVLSGSGGNIAVLIGGDGKFVVDAGVDTSRRQITEALAKTGVQPITHVVNTHWHFDHTGGNDWLHAAGATIIAHENTRKHMSKTTRVEAWNHTFPPAAADALPEVVVNARHEVRVNGETVMLEPYGPCHTDSDLSIRFTNADVLQTGDTWWNGQFPFIDYSTGGSITGTIRAAEANVTAASARTLVIPGHGPVGGRGELVEFRDMLVTVRDRVAALKKKGLSLAEVIATRPTKGYEPWGDFTINADTFTALVFAGV